MIALELDVPFKILVSSVCMANKEAPPATPTSFSEEWGMLRVIIRGFTCGTPSRTSHFRISSTSTPFRSSSTLIVTLSFFPSTIGRIPPANRGQRTTCHQQARMWRRAYDCTSSGTMPRPSDRRKARGLSHPWTHSTRSNPDARLVATWLLVAIKSHFCMSFLRHLACLRKVKVSLKGLSPQATPYEKACNVPWRL